MKKAQVIEAVPVLQVANIKQSLAYYCQKLGFEELFTYENVYAAIAYHGKSMHLACGEPEILNKVKAALAGKAADQRLQVCMMVEGIEELEKNLRSKGAMIPIALREMPYGKEFYLEDPDGNVLGFVQAPG